MMVDNSKKARVLLKKLSKGVDRKGNEFTSCFSIAERNIILYLVKLENRIQELENPDDTV